MLSVTQGDPTPLLRLVPYLALVPQQVILFTKIAENLERKGILNHHLGWDECQTPREGLVALQPVQGRDLPFALSCSSG